MLDFHLENIIYQLGLPQLKKRGKHFHFRCIICGDSNTSKYKKRGWILNRNSDYFYYCHNCGHSVKLTTFLKKNYYHLYVDYLKNKLFKYSKPTPVKEKLIEKIELESLPLKKISELDAQHIARAYLTNRNIPHKHFDNLYYTANYADFIKGYIDKKMKGVESRIVIPIFNYQKKIVGVQGRSLQAGKIRYLTFLFNDDELNVCGLERVNINKKIYVTEGYFDSLFLPNAISMNSANIKLEELNKITSSDKFVFVFDNENRNQQIKRRMLKVVYAGFKICIWPKDVCDWGKDINQMILNDYTRKQIKSTIDNNTYSGILAEVKIKLL